MFIAFAVLGVVVVIGQVQNTNRVNEIQELAQRTALLAHQNRMLAHAICVNQNTSNSLLRDAIGIVVLNQPHLDPIVLQSFVAELGKLKQVQCVP